MRAASYLELVCPAGTPASLRAAVDAGADTVYCSFNDATNARNYPGLNFTPDELAEGVAYAHSKGRSVLVAINTYPEAGKLDLWRQAVDNAAAVKADAVILADVGVLDYAASRHPGLRRHLSVLGAASNRRSVAFYREAFGISRVVLPRIFSLEEVARLATDLKAIGVETEVFAFGNLGTMVEGRCTLSSYITGISPNTRGCCAPAHLVSYKEEDGRLSSYLGPVILNQLEKDEPSGYPSPCKGRYAVGGEQSYLFEEPVGLNAIEVLPQLKAAGVTALKIEGRQRSKAYVASVVRTFREVLDALGQGKPPPRSDLSPVVQGKHETLGAYEKGWR